ncbi:hypothetical protein NIES2100_23120 [Calothrix sp. NIES-2100]|uniref:hypothetical protein n=1 Tax=Calothrix sp. NIES-2100 TaxID=1954172 RepID=UPI000B616D61|nr:hypothetical protein NIES2100_23120 [Calothrix sp. NIES-2100]
MKNLPIYLIVLVLLINLVVACPSWAESSSSLMSNSDYFQVGQKVIWLYKARADSTNVQRIPAEIIKLGNKQVQIKVSLHDNEFVNRWVSRDRLENFPQLKESYLLR